MTVYNLYYHKDTNSWWTNYKSTKENFLKYIQTHGYGLGNIDNDTKDIEILKSYNKDLRMIDDSWVNNGCKMLVGLSVEDCKRMTNNPLGIGILINETL